MSPFILSVICTPSNFVHAFCTPQQSAFVHSGQVYTWGKGENYRLGHGNLENVKIPKILDALQGKPLMSKLSFVFFYLTILLTSLKCS